LLLLVRRARKFDGQVFWFYPLFYAVLRFIIEFYRGDVVRGLYFGGIISTSQIIAIGMIFLSLFMLMIAQNLANRMKIHRAAGRSMVAPVPVSGCGLRTAC
jgi:phosphatidylglycerol:prolipoprotein diacylglycerol transferase